MQEPPTNVGLDSAILMNPATWRASGHLGGKFDDPLMDCKSCKSRHRADNLIENYAAKKKLSINIAGWSNEQMESFIEEHEIACPVCGSRDFTKNKAVQPDVQNLSGVTEDSANTLYLRPETAQGIFVNFKNICRTTRKKNTFRRGTDGQKASATKSLPETLSSA